MSIKSLRAIENIRKIGAEYFPKNFDVNIIDIGKNPEHTSKYQIIAVPTLIKESPMPRRIIIGDLSDTEKVLKILGLTE